MVLTTYLLVGILIAAWLITNYRDQVDIAIGNSTEDPEESRLIFSVFIGICIFAWPVVMYQFKDKL